ncbi:bacillithiol system redox-active protein YtxJ [Sphingobacterium alkalisoli]|uniref:Bacillithiol system redox-active protein YtxJ n=1 Tax=Sphingobacterium alkalisoli TaxID=1874115 RepID=A0A4U0GZB1_9SPHI|nr:bacillithiol system redox-active protein YtxJ [Sphingobacterium alkalisoli]TJY64533.1 bacillithiol system redox-active protein YtxJ [Sphingobacterium alkalisoli]GGH21136.1 thioredoxin family protein [Sphingobacterium alkalisoli]
MNWITLSTLDQLNTIYTENEIVVLFKHSTRCPVSSMAKRSLEFEKGLVPAGAKFYYLDLIAYRSLSNKIAELWNVQHESPQILVTRGSVCLYHASHQDIEMSELIKFL